MTVPEWTQADLERLAKYCENLADEIKTVATLNFPPAGSLLWSPGELIVISKILKRASRNVDRILEKPPH